MQFFTILLLFAALALVKSQDTEVEALDLANCKAESGATDADLQDIFKNAPATNRQVKCMRSCLWKKSGVLNNDGKMVEEPSLAVIKGAAKGDADQLEKGTEAVNACLGIKVAADSCESVEQYIACLVKEMKARGFYVDL